MGCRTMRKTHRGVIADSGYGNPIVSIARASTIRALARPRFQGGIFFNKVQSLAYCAFYLWVAACHKVLGRNIDLNIGVSTVILDIPAHILEPVCIFWLRGFRMINQPMLR